MAAVAVTMPVNWNSRPGISEQVADNVLADAKACPCFTCPHRDGCVTECGSYVRYYNSR